MKTTKQEQEAREHARTRLRELLRPGDTVWTLTTHVSRSGMQRRIRVLVIQGGEPRDISPMVARALVWRYDGSGGVAGVVVNGVGMDMGFHLVYTLSYILATTITPLETTWPATWHRDDPGYALNHRWL